MEPEGGRPQSGELHGDMARALQDSPCVLGEARTERDLLCPPSNFWQWHGLPVASSFLFLNC